MRRAGLDDLVDARPELMVIGGGIYGLMTAREAALRGVRTVLVERGDFGGETSHNSLKIMHGGIRYVQHLDFRRLRISARERAFWQRAAPSLIAPLDFAIPLFGHGTRGPEAFAAAATLYALASAGLRGAEYPAARIVGPRQARDLLGVLAPEGLSGAAKWRDGQIRDANRLHLACLSAVIEAGGRAANYMEARRLLRDAQGNVIGARLRDLAAETERDVTCKIVICCAGAKTGSLVQSAIPDAASRFPGFARAMNIVVDGPPVALGTGVVSRSQSDAVVDRGGRMYFLTPWRGRTIVGTHEAPAAVDTDDPAAEIATFRNEVAMAAPAFEMDARHVLWTYRGAIPADTDDGQGAVRRRTQGTLTDHGAKDGIGGLISLVGVKYTTARHMAARAVDLAAGQLGHAAANPKISLSTALPDPGLAEFDHENNSAVAGRVAAALSAEMATTLSDIVIRRMPLAETGVLSGPRGKELLARIGDLAACASGWSRSQLERELSATRRDIATGTGDAP